MSKKPIDKDSYSAAESQRRFLDALKSGLSTSPKPLKDKPKIRQIKRPTKRKTQKA